ncbi:ATPase family protein associated with various cellular activities (AAA) [Nitrosomonas sp. Nm84]|jgi:SpoVK/Ycf46/Vps4 family AAA+-type ATPase|uniref:ATPase family protein associated with various cellular activities (AAA) n=3 Tax=Nitrosomonadaceae TaxID=206379 RepID=A0A2T5ITY3_9PROT|nr:ATPase family protein associated with various cellular activities (AAA) [Nitrosomonas ureae]PXW85794.1 ATPase family protein associated with various cellular activities (AAA) [Nitrosomonas sp. Nm84]
MLDEMNEVQSDLAQLIRLALAEQTEDVRLFVARLVRKYRNTDPELAEQMDLYLRAKTPRSSAPMRKVMQPALPTQTLPVDDESRLSLLKVFKDEPSREQPLLSLDLEETLSQLIQERRQTERLASMGLSPTRSAIFVGPPGVGKTLTARWLASQLGVPLYVLDLTAVMSSLLGRSGSNLRTALDFSKRGPCVLLLDEVDAIAKRRSDDADIGELKRLVTVILQEVDEWPATSLLLAATNHAELIDPALWRRFDLVINFKAPEMPAVKQAIKRFLGQDYALFGRWIDILTFVFNGESFSDIERDLQRFRRAVALGTASDADLIEEFVKSRALVLERQGRIDLAVLLAKQTRLSQHTISDITGVSRDTIRKYTSEQPPAAKKSSKRKPDA